MSRSPFSAVLLAAVLVIVLATGMFGCSDDQPAAGITQTSTTVPTTTVSSTATTAASSTTTAGVSTTVPIPTTEYTPPDGDADVFQRLSAVMGASSSPAGDRLWYISSNGSASWDLPANSAIAVGGYGSTIAYSDLDTGAIHFRRSQETAADVLLTVGISDSRPPVGDLLALSPDEMMLAVVRTGPATVTHGYLVDAGYGHVEPWAWLDSVVEGGRTVTAVRWNRTSTAVFVSVGGEKDGEDGVTYRYDPWMQEATEVEGVAVVLEVGYYDQVIGLDASPSLVFWDEGELTMLPRDPRLASWGGAWLADSGNTIVVKGSLDDEGTEPCLEVLRLRDDEWTVDHVFTGDGSLRLQYGFGFETGTDIFCFQAGTLPETLGGSVGDVSLYEFDTTLYELYASPLRLPQQEGADFRTLGVIGVGDCGIG